MHPLVSLFFFFFNDTATTEIYTLSLHDALPICVQLFQRSRQGALPTPAALAMLDDVRTSVARIDAAASRAREIARGSAGQLTVGLVSSALFGTLPRALRALRQQAPGVRVILREMSNAEQAEALQTGAIDIGLMHTPVAVGGRMRERQLLRERLVAAVPDEFQIGEEIGRASCRERV